MAYRDDDDDRSEFDTRDDPDPSDMDDADDDGPDVIPCPYCRKEISELADVCPRCGSYISIEDSPRRRPRWLVAGALIALAAVLFIWVLMGR